MTYPLKIVIPNMKQILVALLLTSSCLLVVAQKSGEVGVMLGASNYYGELVDNRFQQFSFAGGIVGRYNVSPYFTARGSAWYGRIQGADSVSEKPENVRRNLSFQSSVFEFSAMGEWNIFGWNPMAPKGKQGFTPFLFGGVAIYKYNPQAWYNGEWYELQPLATEGQGTTQLQDRRKYPLTQVAIPFGMGFKIRVARDFNLGLEYGLRLTFTDYLDDVSTTYVDPQLLAGAYTQMSANLSNRSGEDQGPYDIITGVGNPRGNSSDKDWYSFAGITLTYTLRFGKVKCFYF